jgi:inorganic pyrophosphatase
MCILEDVSAVADAVKAWLFPLSVVFFFAIYPLGLLISVLLDGRAASRASELASAHNAQKSCERYEKTSPKPTGESSSTRPSQTVKIAIVLVVCAALGVIRYAAGSTPGIGDAGVLDAASEMRHAQRVESAKLVETVLDEPIQDSPGRMSLVELGSSVSLHPTSKARLHPTTKDSRRALARVLSHTVPKGHLAADPDHTRSARVSHPETLQRKKDINHHTPLLTMTPGGASDAEEAKGHDSGEGAALPPDNTTDRVKSESPKVEDATKGRSRRGVFGSNNSLGIAGVIAFVVCAGLLAAIRTTQGAQLINRILQHSKGRSQQMPVPTHARRNAVLRRGSECYMACPDVNAHAFIPSGVRVFEAPKTNRFGSLWHNVDLRVKDRFGRETDLYRYINEIPFGALQKFEMKTKEPQNLISEHTSGSKKLQAFGVPVPFNYGCFPQTYRDPTKTDEISGLGGDDDPTDVIDLTGAFVDPGAVVRCRPLGAVCLIDDGEADWKTLVVNVDVESPLSDARSVADVERMAPGRINEALKWLDDFKRHSTVDSRLNFEIHEAAIAVSIIERDYESYCGLVREADSTGFARGHWIGSVIPQHEVTTIQYSLKRQFTSSPRSPASYPTMMDTAPPDTTFMEKVPERMLPIRRQASPNHSSSEDSDASSPASNATSEHELA